MKITVYSTSTCPYCKMLKNYLKEKNIEFEGKLVDKDEEAREQMIKDSGGFLGVPFSVIIKDNGEKQTVIGFDKTKINEALGIS